MNSSISMVSDMGLISQMSYLPFGVPPIVKGDIATGFNDDGKTYTLGLAYTVIEYTDTLSNMQALFLEKNDNQGNPTGEYVIAFRGTQEWQDWVSNGLTGLVNFNPQVVAGRDFVQEMMAKYAISADQITLTGRI